MTDRIPLAQHTKASLDALYDELAALRQVARGYCPHCGRGDAAPTVADWERERQRAEEAEGRLQHLQATSEAAGIVLDRTAAERDALGREADRLRTDWVAQRERADQAEELSRRLLDQRQEMAEERYIWQQRGDRAEALLRHFTAEAHRRKWNYDRGLDDDGQPIGSPAFNALHRLGDEMNTALHQLRANSKPTTEAAA